MKLGRIGYRICQGTLIIELERMHRIISSAPRGGGILRARSILNHQVPANPSAHNHQVATTWRNPARDLGRLAVRHKAMAPVVGLMTAVPMKQLVVSVTREDPSAALPLAGLVTAVGRPPEVAAITSAVPWPAWGGAALWVVVVTAVAAWVHVRRDLA